MGKKKEGTGAAVVALSPYVKRALEDPELRDDLLAAFVAARGLYGRVSKGDGVRGKAEKISDKRFQNELQGLVSDLSDTTEKLKGGAAKKSHKARNRVIMLTGVTLGVLYNPWTGQSTRDWIMGKVSGANGDGLEEFAQQLDSDISDVASGLGSEVEDAATTVGDKLDDAAGDISSKT